MLHFIGNLWIIVGGLFVNSCLSFWCFVDANIANNLFRMLSLCAPGFICTLHVGLPVHVHGTGDTGCSNNLFFFLALLRFEIFYLPPFKSTMLFVINAITGTCRNNGIILFWGNLFWEENCQFLMLLFLLWCLFPGFTYFSFTLVTTYFCLFVLVW